MWFNTFASINENTIIDQWLSQLESEFPNNFDSVSFYLHPNYEEK